MATVGTRRLTCAWIGARHADRAEHQRGERDDAEELLKVIQRIAERLAPVVRRLDPPGRIGKLSRSEVLIFFRLLPAGNSRCR